MLNFFQIRIMIKKNKMTMIKIIITTNNIAFRQSLNGCQSIRQGVNYSTALRNLHFAKNTFGSL